MIDAPEYQPCEVSQPDHLRLKLQMHFMSEKQDTTQRISTTRWYSYATPVKALVIGVINVGQDR